jgi:hypothetical protein
MSRNTYHVIASHSKLTCDKQSQQERSMEQETTAKVYTKDLNLVRAFMVKNGIVKTADGIRVAIEYANAHGALK